MTQIKVGDLLMAQIITNQASLNYQYNGQTGSAVSNIATAILTEALSVEKVSIEDVYRFGEALTYSVSVFNSSSSTLTNVVVTDNLGSYNVGGNTVTPLTYVGDAILFVNGVFAGDITPTSVGENAVTFTLPTLAPNSRAQILYKAVVNSSAPLAEGGTITNVVSVFGAGTSVPPVTDSNTVTVDNYADVTITKNMTPSSVSDGEALTYTFVISNYGNTEATDIVLTDAFDPAPENIVVQVDGETLAASDYSYVGGVLTLPAAGSAYSLSLPAATITQDPATGEVSVVPSSLTVTVVGTI